MTSDIIILSRWSLVSALWHAGVYAVVLAYTVRALAPAAARARRSVMAALWQLQYIRMAHVLHVCIIDHVVQ